MAQATSKSRSVSRRQRARAAPAQAAPEQAVARIQVSGVLELHPKGYGFLRDPAKGYLPHPTDTYVPEALIEQYALRVGALVEGIAQQARAGAGPQLVEITQVEGRAAEDYRNMPQFDRLTPIHPEVPLKLETSPDELSTRILDLFTPIGKGQRALIVAPPRTGKTTLLKQIGQAITTNYPDIKLMVLLVDERPEEVTDFRRSVPAEIIASTLDRDVESHVRLSQLALARAKRLAESGQDAFVIIDSLTRIARSFNKWIGNTGRTMSGGIDIRAMDIPKQLFAAARAFEEGGSLTIVATALIDTGSRMDQLIFEEFKGTGNAEIVLDRTLADRRIWPAIDLDRSGTRREERLLKPSELEVVTLLRRAMSELHPADAMQELQRRLAKTRSNRAFITSLRGLTAADAEEAPRAVSASAITSRR